MIVSFAFCAFLCFYSYVESSRNVYFPSRIMGGEPADIEDFPYMLSLELINGSIQHICGASIIHDSWALTAAHCVVMFPAENLRLRSGTSYRMSGGTLHYVEYFYIHPNFLYDLSKPLDGDISVIKVSTPFQYSNVAQKIVMASETPYTGTVAVVSGWGALNYELELPDQLQQLYLYTIDYEECRLNNFLFYDVMTPRMLCASIPEGGKNFYLGDSGGPLVVDNVQVGIVSFIVENDFECFPGVYTDVAKINSWVTYIIEEDYQYY